MVLHAVEFMRLYIHFSDNLSRSVPLDKIKEVTMDLAGQKKNHTWLLRTQPEKIHTGYYAGDLAQWQF